MQKSHQKKNSNLFFRIFTLKSQNFEFTFRNCCRYTYFKKGSSIFPPKKFKIFEIWKVENFELFKLRHLHGFFLENFSKCEFFSLKFPTFQAQKCPRFSRRFLRLISCHFSTKLNYDLFFLLELQTKLYWNK